MTVHCAVCVNVNNRNPREATRHVGRYEVCDEHAPLLKRHVLLVDALTEITGVKRCGPRNAT
jgi:hypothetical protein